MRERREMAETSAAGAPGGRPWWPMLLAIPVAAAALAGLAALYLAVVLLRLPAAALPAGPIGDTAYIREAAASGRCPAIAHVEVPLAAIDPRLACAVVWAEDRRFFWHDGFDGRSFGAALEASWGAGAARFGGSTIAMQLARNLHLSADRTATRKLREILIARRLVAGAGHRRVLEAYLATAEWAPCVYGAESAARHYFGHGAAALDPAEATLLAALLPRPGHAPGYRAADRDALIRRQQMLLSLWRRADLLDAAGLTAARARVASMWASGLPSTGGTAAAAAPAPIAWLERRCGTRASGLLPLLRDEN